MVQLSPRKGPPGCEVSCHGTEWTCNVGSSVILQSGPTHSLVAKFPQRSVVACSTRISCCRGRMLQTRPRTGMCEPLMPDVMAPEMHQNNRSYVRSADLPSDTLRENFSMVGCYTENPEKQQNCQNCRGGRLHGYGRLLGTIRY